MPSPIDPTKFPAQQVYPDLIDIYADSLKTEAGTIRELGSGLVTTWQGLSGVYSAPEASTVLDLMTPVGPDSTAVGDNLETVSGALTGFAESARAIKAELALIKIDADDFLSRIDGGVQVREVNPAWTTTHNGYLSTATPTYSSSSVGGGTDPDDIPQYRTVTKEWHEVQSYVDENNALLDRVDAQQVLLWEAERTAANTIRALWGGAALHAYQSEDDPLGYGLDEIPEGTEMPWGTEVERTESCGESAVKFVFKDFLWEGVIVGGVWGTITGLGTLVLGYNPATGDFFSGEAYGTAWSNLGLLAAGILIRSNPITNVVTGIDSTIRQFGGDGFLPTEVRDFVDKTDEALLNTGKGIIAWDKWADDPGTALGESVFNVGTILIPAGAAVAGVKSASLAASVLGRMARVVDLVDPGAWAVNGATRLTGLTLGGIDNLVGRIGGATPIDLNVLTASDAFTGLRQLDDLGVDLNTVTVRMDGDVPVFEAPGVRIEMPGDAFENAVRDAGIRPGDGADVSVAPVREPELVTAGGGDAGPGVVNSIVDEAPVRAETGGSGSGESTVVRDPDTTTGGFGGDIGDAVRGTDGAVGGTGADTVDSASSGGPGEASPVDGDAGRPSEASTGDGSDDIVDGGGPRGGTPDQPYVPWTSRQDLTAFPGAEVRLSDVAADHGMTMPQVRDLLRQPIESLTPDQVRAVMDLRESIPKPVQGEIMQKIISVETWDRMINPAADGSVYAPEVGGFVSRAADAQALLTSNDLAHGLGLDYDPGRTFPPAFLAPDGSVGDVVAIRFAWDESQTIRVPYADLGERSGYLFDLDGEAFYRPQKMDPLGPDNPFHGHGFVGDSAIQAIPEFELPARVPVGNRAEAWRITPAGDEILLGWFDSIAQDWRLLP